MKTNRIYQPLRNVYAVKVIYNKTKNDKVFFPSFKKKGQVILDAFLKGFS
jgi:hypothetical protein